MKHCVLFLLCLSACISQCSVFKHHSLLAGKYTMLQKTTCTRVDMQKAQGTVLGATCPASTMQSQTVGARSQ